MINASIATIQFRDDENEEQAVLIVRRIGDHIGLAVSLAGNGDVEVFLDPKSCSSLVDALSRGLRDLGARDAP